MAKAYAKNKTQLRKELGDMGIVPKNIRELKVRNASKPWFSFDISNKKIKRAK